jgi:hypothetical protein
MALMDNFAEFINGPVGILSVGAATFATGWLLFGADTRVEDRRRRAIEFARKLSALGFKKLPALFEDYAVGDYSGMFRAMKELHDVMQDPAQRQAELEAVFKLLLEEKFRDPAQKQALLKLVDDLKAATAEGKNPLDATGPLARDVMDLLRSGGLGNSLLTASAAPAGSLNLHLLDGFLRRLLSGQNLPAAGPIAGPIVGTVAAPAEPAPPAAA